MGSVVRSTHSTGCSPAGGACSQTLTTFSAIVGGRVAARRALVCFGSFFGHFIVSVLAAMLSRLARDSRGGWMMSCVGDRCFWAFREFNVTLYHCLHARDG